MRQDDVALQGAKVVLRYAGLRQQPEPGVDAVDRLVAGGMVIDETVAFLLVLFFTPEGWLWQVAAFVLFRIFDIIWALTLGGPGTMTETISIYAYSQGFKQFETSYTAAMAFLVIAILTVVVTWAIRRMELVK